MCTYGNMYYAILYLYQLFSFESETNRSIEFFKMRLSCIFIYVSNVRNANRSWQKIKFGFPSTFTENLAVNSNACSIYKVFRWLGLVPNSLKKGHYRLQNPYSVLLPHILATSQRKTKLTSLVEYLFRIWISRATNIDEAK